MGHSNQFVFDPHRSPKMLGSLLARGGEGEIYPLAERPDVLIKWYHAADLQKRGSTLKLKVEAMRGMSALQKESHLSWPLFSVFDDNNNWIGYSMYRAKGLPMFKLSHAVLYKKNFPNLDRRRLVDYLINLVSQVQNLHQKGVMLGDYNMQNILCNPDNDHVTLIDCDSYQISVQGIHYPCPVGSADMTPKEQQNREFSQIVRTSQSEAFSLAIILFKCLMLGRHPYDIVGGDDPVQNLCNGNFAYGIGNKGVPKGPWYNIWSHMPHRLKSLFIATFTDGADYPDKRASLNDWLEALTLYAKEIDKGWHEVAILPAAPKAKTYRGSTTGQTLSA